MTGNAEDRMEITHQPAEEAMEGTSQGTNAQEMDGLEDTWPQGTQVIEGVEN